MKLLTALIGIVIVPATWFLFMVVFAGIIEIAITKWAMGGLLEILVGGVSVGCIITLQVATLTEFVAPIFLDAKRMVSGNETQV